MCLCPLVADQALIIQDQHSVRHGRHPNWLQTPNPEWQSNLESHRREEGMVWGKLCVCMCMCVEIHHRVRLDILAASERRQFRKGHPTLGVFWRPRSRATPASPIGWRGQIWWRRDVDASLDAPSPALADTVGDQSTAEGALKGAVRFGAFFRHFHDGYAVSIRIFGY